MSEENDLTFVSQIVPQLPGYTPPDEQNLSISQLVPNVHAPVVDLSSPSVLSAMMPEPVGGGGFSHLRSIAREAIPELVEEEPSFDDKMRNTFYQISYDDYADVKESDKDDDEVDLSDNEKNDELNHSSISIVLDSHQNDDTRKRLESHKSDGQYDDEDSLSVVIHPTLDRTSNNQHLILTPPPPPRSGLHNIMAEAIVSSGPTTTQLPTGGSSSLPSAERAIISAMIPNKDDSVIDLDRSETSQQVQRTVVLAEMMPTRGQQQLNSTEPAFISVNPTTVSQPTKDQNVKKGIASFLGPLMQRIQKKEDSTKLKNKNNLDPNDPIAVELSNIAAITAQVMQPPTTSPGGTKSKQKTISHHQQQTPPTNGQQPNDYIEYSILNALCCCLCLGLPAIFFSVNTRQANNDPSKRDTAIKSSRLAKWLNIAAFVIGLIVWMIVLIVILAETTKKK